MSNTPARITADESAPEGARALRQSPQLEALTDAAGKIAQAEVNGGPEASARQGTDTGCDFISDYASFADVFEAPRKVHECIAWQLIASAMNGNVFIPWGASIYSLDLLVLLLTESGGGRNTAADVALKVVEKAGISGLLHKASWGSGQAFYQRLAESPRGLYVWQELSVVLRALKDTKFAGVKEWFTDRYDNLRIPPAVTYRSTGRRQDTPPIVFGEAPRINVLATSSWDWFISGLEQEDTTGGFIPRWVLVRPGPSKRVLPKPLALSQALIPALAATLKAISELSGLADLSAVEETYDQWYRAARRRFESQPNAALAMPFFNRLRGHVLKLAVIFEVSQSGSLKVSERAMQRAIEAASEIECTIFEILPTGMNREGSEVEKMAERIRNTGPAGISHSKLTLAFKHWKSQEREGRLRTLVESQTVHCFLRQTRGRTGRMYAHREHVRRYRKSHPQEQPCS